MTTTETEKNETKNCPFCGNSPTIDSYEVEGEGHIHSINCTNCGFHFEDTDLENLLKKWNFRPGTKRVKDALQEIIEINKDEVAMLREALTDLFFDIERDREKHGMQMTIFSIVGMRGLKKSPGFNEEIEERFNKPLPNWFN